MTWIEIVIKFIIPLAATILTYKIIPMLKQRQIYDYVKIGVLAAEQLYGSGKGNEKFKYVKDWIKSKFKISDEDLEKIIEACVHEINKV